MKKIILAVFGILLIYSVSHALDKESYFTDHQMNGRMWIILNDSDKLYYIVGLTEGINYCSSEVKLTFNKEEISPEVSKRVLQNLGHLITGEKNQKMVEAIDNFYKDPLNLDIPVTSAYYVFVGKFKGFLDKKSRQEMIEGMRKNSATKIKKKEVE